MSPKRNAPLPRSKRRRRKANRSRPPSQFPQFSSVGDVEKRLSEAGYLPDAQISTTVFLADINDFAAMNGVYATFFPDPPPARTTVEVAALPKGFKVEIEAIARRP